MNHPILDHPACSVRLYNRLVIMYPEEVPTDLVRTDVLTGKLHPAKIYGYGKRSHHELCTILGINQAATRQVKVKPWWIFHPMTGQQLKP